MAVRLKASILGLATAIGIALILLNFVPYLNVPLIWKVVAIAGTCASNLVWWKKEPLPPMSLGKALGYAAMSILGVSVIAAIDVGIGFAFGKSNVWEAFWGSGQAGGIVDAFLAIVLLLVFFPSLVRSVAIQTSDEAVK